MKSNIATGTQGALAGAAATAVMSVIMLLGQKTSRVGKLPPKKIVEAGLDASGVQRPDEEVLNALTAVAHVGYGMAAGAVYSASLGNASRLSPLVSGPLFALAVWAGSYEGWVPALGIMPRARRDRPARTTTMIVAHVVYGAILGLLGSGSTAGHPRAEFRSLEEFRIPRADSRMV
jgi:hypothetical protein